MSHYEENYIAEESTNLDGDVSEGAEQSSTAATKMESSSGYSSSPSTPTSPISVSPPNTLKRSRSSTFRMIDRRTSTASISSQISFVQEPAEDFLANVIGWYPAFLLRIAIDLTYTLFYICVRQLPFVIPTLWLSAYLWIFWKVVQLPLAIIKGVLVYAFIPPSERLRKKRTVLISGGSTVQAIHLARNFYSAGARVVVCETEGHFGLARFSTAVNKYYIIPEPSDDRPEVYVDALKKIVLQEKVNYYIPVSKTSPTYYDSLAKPHIEALGCECFCPEVKELFVFEDLAEFIRRIQYEGMVTPKTYYVQSKDDLARLYDTGTLRIGKHFMVNVGPNSLKRKHKIELPHSQRRLKLTEPISEMDPWLVIKDYHGHHFITCTTVKESRVVANVTCRLDSSGHGLVPIEHREIELWLKQFFASLKFHRNIVGHMSFVFATADDESGSVVPLECHVGVKLPYICYTSVHPRIVWKPCKHFSRSTSGPVVTDAGRYWINEVFLKTITHPSVEAVTKLAGMIFDRREALFTYWDPLPYCAFYYLQLPLERISKTFHKSSKRLFINS